MGAGGTGGHKNQASRVKIVCARDFREAMVGEISPDMMFFLDYVKSHKNACRCMRSVSDWCGGMQGYGEARNQGEGGRNSHAGRVL